MISKTKAALTGLMMAGSMLAATPALANVTFILNDLGGTAPGTQARKGFEYAAAYWSSVLTNNVTINLNIGFSALDPGVLGQAGSRTALVFNSNTYAALAGSVSSTLDATAVANLRPLTPTASFGVNGIVMTTNALNAAGTGYIDTATRVDTNGSGNNVVLGVNTSVAKALGLTTDAFGATIPTAGADGSIQFSNLFAFDFDPTDGIDPLAFDFVGVAIHEIGHVLGFRSGVDTYDAFTAPGSGNTRTGALEAVGMGTTLDLFRYSSTGVLDWSTQNTPYFSIDGGANQLFGDSRFAQGVRNGDGRQASHFKDSPPGPQLGILDPTSGRGQLQEITALDLAAFDALGWGVGFDVLRRSGYRTTTGEFVSGLLAVPEPSTWAMMIGGFGFVGGMMRRRGRKVSVAYA